MASHWLQGYFKGNGQSTSWYTSFCPDDILVTSVTEQEHLQSLEEVLKQLEKSGL